MKKIVRLTESDLVRLVKRVINEQNTDVITKDMAGRYKSLFIGPYMSYPDATSLAQNSRTKPYFAEVLIDDTALIGDKDSPMYGGSAARFQNDRAQVGKQAEFGQIKRNAVKILGDCELTYNGKKYNLKKGYYLNTCDSRIQECPWSLISSLQFNTPGETPMTIVLRKS